MRRLTGPAPQDVTTYPRVTPCANETCGRVLDLNEPHVVNENLEAEHVDHRHGHN